MPDDDNPFGERLARIEVKLDQVLAHRDDHEARLRVLEKLIWRTSGAAMAFGSLGGFVATKLFGG